MNLSQMISLQGGNGAMEHYETFQVVTPIPHSHPPSLKNAPKVEPETAQDGWRRGDSKKKKKRARKDLRRIIEKTMRQSGRPVMVRHSPGADPWQWNPSQIADL